MHEIVQYRVDVPWPLYRLWPVSQGITNIIHFSEASNATINEYTQIWIILPSRLDVSTVFTTRK